MKKLLIVAALASASLAHAEFWDGNELLRNLTSTNAFEQGAALGYVVGVSDTVSGIGYCAPGTSTARQHIDIVKQWLEVNPAQRHKTADIVTRVALSSAFPCKAKQPTQYPL